MTWRPVGLLAVLLLAGCGGGGGGSGPEPVVFQVTAVLPRSSSENVPLTEEVLVTFSKRVDPASLTPESFRIVAESGDEIVGTRTVTPLPATQVRFRPLSGYFPFASHTVEVTRDVLDEQGEPLDRDYTFVFRTEEEGPVLPVQAQIESKGNPLNAGRFLHRMTLLPDGLFLVAGGYALDGEPALKSAERLDWTTAGSVPIGGGLLGARAAHVQIALPDGRVLLAGGESSSFPFIPLSTCETFNPVAGTFASAPSLHFARSFAHAALLADGRVLLTGGQGLATDGVTLIFRADAEIYDPVADTWTLVGSRMEAGRSAHFTAVTAAGAIVIGGTPAVPSATLWREDTESFSLQLGTPLFHHFFGLGTVLPDGRPFVASGVDSLGITIWDSRYGFLGAINQLQSERPFGTATAFLDGRVLLVGGFDLTSSPPKIHDTLDVFFPIGATGRVFRAAVRLPKPTSHHAAERGPDGRIWVTGGIGTLGDGLRQVYTIRPEE